MAQEFWIAICLVFVIEGILPFLAPKLWRQSILQLANFDDKSLRIVGLVSMIAGTIALYIVH